MTGFFLPASEDGISAVDPGVQSRPPSRLVSRPGSAAEPPSDRTSSPAASDPGSDGVWDLGPPGFEATIDVFKCTIDEKTIYLGPWEIVEDPRRIVWQCSYQNERLEHFLPPSPTDDANDDSALQSVFPFTFHGKHTQFSRPLEGEQAVTFQVPHRLRYTSHTNEVVFDQEMKPLYRFMTIASSLRFQSDLRQKALVDCFDADIVWTDAHRRENMYGGAMGIAAIQRVKLWRSARSGLHSISVYASRWGQQHKEYNVRSFDADLHSDDKKRRVMLVARRPLDRHQLSPPFSFGSTGLLQWVLGSVSSGSVQNNVDATNRFDTVLSRRPSVSSNASSRMSSYAGSFASSRTSISSYAASLPDPPDASDLAEPLIGIRYLAIEFTLNRDYQRFLKEWAQIHPADLEASAPPTDTPDLGVPSPAMLPSDRSTRGTATVLPPLAEVPRPR